MAKLYFATMNKGKVNYVESILSKYGIELIHRKLKLPELQSYDLKQIARQKVIFAYDKIGKQCIALDAGFYIHSLNGFPKTFVNFVLETIGLEGILKLVEGKDRSCEFRNCLAYFDGKLAEPVCFESTIRGHLSDFPRGKLPAYAWSKLFLIFVPEGESKTLAEMNSYEYKTWLMHSWKNSCAAKFAEWFLKKKTH